MENWSPGPIFSRTNFPVTGPYNYYKNYGLQFVNTDRSTDLSALCNSDRADRRAGIQFKTSMNKGLSKMDGWLKEGP